ncbi:hypothetical protein CROQUDRAFT_9250, partial [Cronartium quercuum f. sp. fusiforme G11]
LYEILLIKPTATINEIKTSYKKLALKYHPDKLPINATSEVILLNKEKFEKIGLAYTILSDPKKRERYDKFGKTDGFLNDDDMGDMDWSDYFKELWSGMVNSTTIEEFTKKYQGSEEEVNDIKENYHKSEGNLEIILENLMCHQNSDEKRIIELIDSLIKKGELDSTKTWIKTKNDEKAIKKRQKISKKEESEAKKLLHELGLNNNQENDLKSLILNRSKERHETLIDKLESKIKKEQDKNKKSTKKRNSNQEDLEVEIGPTEEEFKKIQDQIESRRKKPLTNSEQPSTSTSSKSRPKKKTKTS